MPDDLAARCAEEVRRVMEPTEAMVDAAFKASWHAATALSADDMRASLRAANNIVAQRLGRMWAAAMWFQRNGDEGDFDDAVCAAAREGERE